MPNPKKKDIPPVTLLSYFHSVKSPQPPTPKRNSDELATPTTKKCRVKKEEISSRSIMDDETFLAYTTENQEVKDKNPAKKTVTLCSLTDCQVDLAIMGTSYKCNICDNKYCRECYPAHQHWRIPECATCNLMVCKSCSFFNTCPFCGQFICDDCADAFPFEDEDTGSICVGHK